MTYFRDEIKTFEASLLPKMAVKLKVSPVKAHKRCVKIAFYIAVNCIDLIKINALMQIHLVVLFLKHFIVL